MARCCVLLANGFEEIEAITVIDVLRRADVDVVTLGVEGPTVRGAHDVVVNADALLADGADETWDLVVLPGGMPGSATLRDHPDVQRLVRSQHEAERRVAAICAAPIALHSAGILDGRATTSYPGFEEQLVGADYRQDRVVVDGLITTSRGAGTAMEFALELVAQLAGPEQADSLRSALLAHPANVPT